MAPGTWLFSLYLRHGFRSESENIDKISVKPINIYAKHDTIIAIVRFYCIL